MSFSVIASDHVAEIERTLLLRHASVKDDLKEQVAQFVAEVIEVATGDRVRDLVGFLDGVWRDRCEILLQVPWAAGFRRAQRRHDLDQPCDIAGGFQIGRRDARCRIVLISLSNRN